MNERNVRVQARYDELMREGKHGHYETLLKVVNEEVERLEAAIEQAKHKLEAYRIWGGAVWAVGHPLHVERAWEVLREALEGK